LLRRTPLAAAIAAAVATTAPTVVVAQPADETLEVFIVSATRRDESIQEVPLNIAAFDGSQLEDREIGDLAELGRNVPGMYVVDQGKRTSNRVVVRGLNLASISSTEGIGNNAGGTVATYVGEIPMYIDLGIVDLDRVEVLLGPQGTLYGAGTLGGAIRYIPQKPQTGETTLSFRAATFDVSEGDMGVRGGVTGNFPMGDNFALRFSVDHYDDPGFMDTPYLVRESGVSDPEPDLTNPADVSANLYSAEDVNSEECAGRPRAALSTPISRTTFRTWRSAEGRKITWRPSAQASTNPRCAIRSQTTARTSSFPLRSSRISASRSSRRRRASESTRSWGSAIRRIS
jgi:outer membrane receptor protein involved in Fe transport